MATTFDGHPGDRFVAYYEQVGGAIREQLTREHLAPYLEHRQGGRVLDIGGGDGRDAAWLAEQGFDVTLVEPSEDMLERAEARFASGQLAVRTIQADSEALPEVLEGETFDVVLSHGVLMYLKEPGAHLATIHERLAPKGVLSLLTKGYRGAYIWHEWAGYQEELRRLEQEGGRYMTNMNVEATAYRPEQIMTMMHQAELSVLKWFGVRVDHFHDRRPLQEVDAAEWQSILGLERQLARGRHSRHKGQMLQYIASRQ